MHTVKVLFSKTPQKDKKTLVFHGISPFIEWFCNNDMPNININSDLTNITKSEIQNLCQFLTFSKQIKMQIEQANKYYNIKYLKENSLELQEALNELIRVNSGGKSLRASLIALGYLSGKAQDQSYLPLAVAFELFQTSILIHDDIIDNASMRRGQSTIPESYNQKYHNPKTTNQNFLMKKHNFANSMGLCIGDLGFYIANEIITTAYQDNPHLAQILSYYNQIIIKTCKGEMLDIILPFKEEYFMKDPNLEVKIFQIYQLKTAWYSVIGPFCLGLILNGEKEENIKVMENILLDLGVAFQIKDDLLGIYGNEENIGKSTNSDIEEYKQTILYAYTMTTEYKNELLKYYGTEMNSQKNEKVKEIFINSGAKQYAETKMSELFKNSQQKLSQIQFISDKYKSLLAGFITYLKNREK